MEFGIHPIHFGTMIVFNLCVGVITPPVGNVLLVGVRVAGLRIEPVISKLLPFLFALIVGLFVVVFVPQLSVWLPTTMGLMGVSVVRAGRRTAGLRPAPRLGRPEGRGSAVAAQHEHADERVSTRVAAQAWESLFRAQVTLMRRFEGDGDFAPLRAREYDVLFTLSRAPEHRLRLRDLNEHVLLSQPSLSRMVERLEGRTLVRREPAPDDARGLVVVLTEEGLVMQRHVARRHVRSIRRYVGGALSEDELRTLTELTGRLRSYRP